MRTVASNLARMAARLGRTAAGLASTALSMVRWFWPDFPDGASARYAADAADG